MYQQKVTSSSGLSHGHSKQERNFVVTFLWYIHKKNVPVRVPGHWALAKVQVEIVYIYILFEHVFINTLLPF